MSQAVGSGAGRAIDPKRYVRLLRIALEECQQQSIEYGKCLQENLKHLRMNVCQQQFQQYLQQ